MKDQLGIFDSPDDTGDLDLAELREALARTADSDPPASRTADRRHERAAAVRRRRRRRRSTVAAVLVMAVIAAGVVVGLAVWRKNSAQVLDWAGSGTTEVVVRVQSSDSLDDIADTLAAAGVVANARAFSASVADDADIAHIHVGYYKVRLHASNAATANALVDPASRVGTVRIIPGRQLADVSTKSGTVVPGYITAIAKASCVELNGQPQNCFNSDDLWTVEETATPSQLSVVDWAAGDVLKAPDPRKRLEGLILPGDYDIPPGSSPLQTLSAVVGGSSALWNSQDIIADAKTMGITPYQAAVIASLVQSEAISTDMPKVARVVYNRLHDAMKLQFDSTVNYALGRAQIATSLADLKTPSPYNTYAHAGLPPTPISSPGQAALDATLQPVDGPWLYFVKIDKDGNSCFSTTLAQHNACVDKARANGVFG